MTVLQRIRRFVRGLVVLALLCVGVEQILYLMLVPGYFWSLVASPMLWGVFSARCFFQLWRFNQQHQDKRDAINKIENNTLEYEVFLDGLINPSTGFPMKGGMDSSCRLFGQEPSIG